MAFTRVEWWVLFCAVFFPFCFFRFHYFLFDFGREEPTLPFLSDFLVSHSLDILLCLLLIP